MKILKKSLIGLVGLVILVAIVGFLLPGSVHVERAITVNAPPEKVFDLVNSYENFNKWSPWYDRDPDAEYRFEGPASGVGAKMHWKSEQRDVGSGSQEIIESRPGRLVRTALDFGAQGTAIAFFEFEPEGNNTNVTWGFDSEFGNNIIGRYMGLMFDGWIGADYEQGLANLKRLAESSGG
ncbi:MAG: SRPBCC family protein [Gammaproteobacteria bacterium]